MSNIINIYTAEEKVRLSLEWVAKQEPWVIPTVLVKWAVTAVAEKSKCPTMQTNGRVMNYNPSFVDRLSLSASKCIVLHEVAHVINFHNHRRGNRNPKGWNIAADLAINNQLWNGFKAAYNGDVNKMVEELVTSKESGGCFTGYGPFADLPPCLSAEEYYDLLKQRNPPPPPKPPTPTNNGDDDSDSDGDDSDSDSDGDDSDTPAKGKGKGKGKPKSKSKSKSDDEEPEEGSWDDVFNSDDDEGDDITEEESGDTDPEGNGDTGSGISPSDFEDGDSDGDSDSDEFEGDGQGGDPLGNKGKDPFADLPDPTETFGGGVEDAPDDVPLREDEAALILEILLGGDNYGKTGLGEFMSKFKQRIDGDPEIAAQVNWRKELEKFLRTQHAAGWKYDRPSRRHSHRSDVVLPARRARSKTRGLCIVDTSGSMGDDECGQSIAHLGKILGLFPQSTVTLAMCDTAVRSSKEYRASDFPIREFEGWKGRGATNLAPAFRWAKDNKSKFDWIVVVSDMEWDWWNAPNPGLPVLWINTRRSLWGDYNKLPFGKLVNFHAQK
jgi:predicted metal-dependent peptidase